MEGLGSTLTRMTEGDECVIGLAGENLSGQSLRTTGAHTFAWLLMCLLFAFLL